MSRGNVPWPPRRHVAGKAQLPRARYVHYCQVRRTFPHCETVRVGDDYSAALVDGDQAYRCLADSGPVLQDIGRARHQASCRELHQRVALAGGDVHLGTGGGDPDGATTTGTALITA